MRHVLNGIIGWFAVGVLGAIAAGLLIAAAVVGFANVVGTAGALGIVGALLAALALVVVLVLRNRPRPLPVVNSKVRVGEVAAGFLMGVWDGLSKPRPRGPV